MSVSARTMVLSESFLSDKYINRTLMMLNFDSFPYSNLFGVWVIKFFKCIGNGERR